MEDRNELHRIRKYTRKMETDRAIHNLEGIMKGISADQKITQDELEELRSWIGHYYQFLDRHPFNELIPVVMGALDDNVLTDEETKDILWLAEKLTTENEFYDVLTSDVQRLHGMLHGILADNVVTDEEIQGLKRWLFDNEQLRGTYPFDELSSLVISILADGKVDDHERDMLTVFIGDFVDTAYESTIDRDRLGELKKTMTIGGGCAGDPEIEFNGRLFTFTGTSSKATRSDVAKIVSDNGGVFKDNVVKDTNYLVVGAEGNPCWAFACYGRKVEKAVAMRRVGLPIVIVNEIDFWDVAAD